MLSKNTYNQFNESAYNQFNEKLDKSKLIKNDTDNIYYNVIWSNNNTNGKNIPLTYQETRVQPILDRPSDYYLSIVRMSIDGFNIPLFIFKPNTYQITLNFNGQRIDQNITFISRQNLPVTDPTYFYVYDFDHMIDMINNAVDNAFFSLVGIPAGALPPFFEYDPETQLIYLYAQNIYYNTGATVNVLDATTIYISCNEALFNFVQGLSIYYNQPNANKFLFIVEEKGDNLINPTTATCPTYLGVWNANTNTPALVSSVGTWNSYYVVSNTTYPGLTVLNSITNWSNGDIVYFNGLTWAKYNSVSCIPAGFLKVSENYVAITNWFDFQSLVVTSSSLPIRQEYIPASGQLVNSQSGNVTSLGIITDFIPAFNNASDFRSIIQYTPESQYRLVDMTGYTPLTKIDLSVYWQDKLNNLYILEIDPNQSSSLKILFTRKDLYKNYNPNNY